MGAKVSFDMDGWNNTVMTGVNEAKSEMLGEMKDYMIADLKSAIDNSGLRDGVTEKWKPPKFSTIVNRRMFPFFADGPTQTKYIREAVPLKDTKALQESIGLLNAEIDGEKETLFIGASKPYIATHEDGLNGVPQRKNQYFTLANIVRLAKIAARWFHA